MYLPRLGELMSEKATVLENQVLYERANARRFTYSRATRCSISRMGEAALLHT